MTEFSPTQSASVHIINHTHWDREWFLTEEYTTEWIPELIDAIDELQKANPNYQYLFDGQTLALEDLLRTQPHYEALITRLVSAGVLGIGPLYSQPDWRLASGELLVRNASAGTTDVARHGGKTQTAWLVDTFGHISQAPQILAMFGVTTAYVWRGVPELEPLFCWVSPDGTEVAAINLFGGYRNLYGISRTKSLATRRLQGEYDKLVAYYRGLPIPLFDGYDLETEPEDPFTIFRERDEGRGAFDLVESSPERYARAVAERFASVPKISGELLSGKYGSTFPGTLSTRTYLKVLHADVEHALHRVCEPLATLAAVCGAPYPVERYDQWDRELLRNVIHDCICGVSVDPVHERMERSYRRLLQELKHDAERSTEWLARGMQDGRYVVSSTPFARSGSLRVGPEVIGFDSEGLGLAPVSAVERFANSPSIPLEEVKSPFGSVIVSDEAIDIGGVVIGPLTVRRDVGDAYSSESREQMAAGRVMHAEVESVSDLDVVVLIELKASWSAGEIHASMRFRFSHTKTVELEIDIDSRGTDYIAELLVAPGQGGTVLAGMPFDVVQRETIDTELFGHEIDVGLARVLMGQREVDEVTTFPFQDFVASFENGRSVIVHARGLRAYRVDDEGVIAIPLRRSVEWLAKTGLRGRAGDAGPSMYVPGARCERVTRHELGVSVIEGSPDSEEFVALCESFRNPPIAVEIAGSEGTCTRWEPLRYDLPITALRFGEDGPLERFYNPTASPKELGGREVGRREIVELPLILDRLDGVPANVSVRMHGFATDRGGRSRSLPDESIVEALQEESQQLWAKAADLRESLEELTGDAYHLALPGVARAERLRQDDAVTGDRRTRDGGLGPHHHRRTRCDLRTCRGPQDLHGVSELRDLSAHVGSQQYWLRSADEQGAEGSNSRTGRRGCFVAAY
ncbi:MAG: hypothetical protein F4Y27_06065 [Acidimicrobiaceae bacterium]|nr:hypothetical protein [Acidimicrobiaceae bacterium]MYG55180.1 hypothetical protein [Acidimicrobiaceae bacterium]MYJ99744.1 hypothetical protein [Acidimicrobiaceae bacterium]